MNAKRTLDSALSAVLLMGLLAELLVRTHGSVGCEHCA